MPVLERHEEIVLDYETKKKFYVRQEDLRYNSKDALGKMKNGRAVENELAEVLL